MKIQNAFALTALALAAAPLAAQDAAPAAGAAPAAAATANVTAGAKVFDAQGGEVGTVDSVTGGVAVVNTGTNKVGLPLASFGAGANGPIISMTKTELDAEYVTVERPKGSVKLPMSAFGKGDKGVMISMTAEELDQAMAAAAPAK